MCGQTEEETQAIATEHFRDVKIKRPFLLISLCGRIKKYIYLCSVQALQSQFYFVIALEGLKKYLKAM